MNYYDNFVQTEYIHKINYFQIKLLKNNILITGQKEDVVL